MVSDQSYSIAFRTVKIGENTYFVPQYASHRPVAAALTRGELWEPKTLRLVESLLRYRPGSMVHAGAFFGDMLPSFSKACPSLLYAFEPVLENFILAKLCVEGNDLENVLLLNSGLGSSIGPGRVDTGDEGSRHRGGGSTISGAGQMTVLLTVDALQIPDLALLQLDVEGHELEVLQGAQATLARAAPIILIEDNLGNCGSFLEAREYSLVGAIPGLAVWAGNKDAGAAAAILKNL